MKKILCMTTVLLCFASNCVDHKDVQSAINNNISECEKQNGNIHVENTAQRTRDILSIINHKDYVRYVGNKFSTIECTWNNIPCYMRLNTIAAQLFVFFLKTPECANFATQVASDYFLLPEQTIDIQSYNALFRNNKLLIYENPTSLRDIVNDTNPEVNKLLDFNKKLKNLMDFDERRLFIVKEEEYDLTTKAALREVINKLENNRANMNTINELLTEYFNLENYYFYYPNLLNLEIREKFWRDIVLPRPNTRKQNEIKQERRIEIKNFFIDIMDILIDKTNNYVITNSDYYAITNSVYKHLFNNFKNRRKDINDRFRRESALCVEIAKSLLYYQSI